MNYFNIYAKNHGDIADTMVDHSVSKISAVKMAVRNVNNYDLIWVQFERDDINFEVLKLDSKWDS